MLTVSQLGVPFKSGLSWPRYWMPRNVVLTPISGGFRITWSNRDNTNETEIWIAQDSGALTLITTTGLGIETYDYLCASGHDYTVELRAKFDQTVLSIPTGFSATDNLDGTVTLECDTITGADHYEWWANIASAGYALITTTVNPTYLHNVGGSIQVLYKVRAKEGTLPVYSGYTSEIDITTAATWDARALQIFANKLTADAVAYTDARKTAINNYIKALKAANLFDTQFDVLVFTRGMGAGGTKLNWIKDSSNAAGSAIYQADVGYNSNDIATLHTNYTPSSDGVLWTLNDCCFGKKTSGSVISGSFYSGGQGSGGSNGSIIGSNGGIARLNSTLSGTGPTTVGYTCISRNASDKFHLLENSADTEITAVSTSITAQELYIMGCNANGSELYICPSTEIYECYFMGESISQANFLIFQSLTNTFFSNY